MFIICQGRSFLLLATGIKKLDTPLNADSPKMSPRVGGGLVHDVERSCRRLIWGIYVTWLSKTTENVSLGILCPDQIRPTSLQNAIQGRYYLRQFSR